MADYDPNVYPKDGDLWGVMIRMLKIGAKKVHWMANMMINHLEGNPGKA